MRSHFQFPKLKMLGMVGSWLLVIAWTGPAFGADASGTDMARASGHEASSLEAKQLSDAELDEITAGFNLYPPDPIHATTGIPGLGAPPADAAMKGNFTRGSRADRAPVQYRESDQSFIIR